MRISSPKKPRTTCRIKNARKAIIRPMMEAIIVSLAPCTFALSPPEVIQRMPPQMRKKRAIRAAAISKTVTVVRIIVPILLASRLQSPLKFEPPVEPEGHGFTGIPPAAKAGVTRMSGKMSPSNVAKTFFIKVIMYS